MINEIKRMQHLAGIKLNELQVNNPYKAFHIIGHDDDDGELKIIELLDKDKRSHGWWGHYPYNDSDYSSDIVNIEFLFEQDEENDQHETENMNELIKYCKDRRIKYNILDVNNDGELFYIQIPIDNIDMSKIDEEF